MSTENEEAKVKIFGLARNLPELRQLALVANNNDLI